LKAKELVDSGILGRIQLIRGAFSFKLEREGNYRWKSEMGGGSIWDVGCYPISFGRTLTGSEPIEVFGWQVTGQGGSDDSFIGQMKFQQDIHMQFDCGFKSPARSMMEIVGSEGILHIPNPFKPGSNNEIYLTRNGEIETIMVPGRELYLGEVEDMCDAVLLGSPQRIPLEDSRKNVAVILALLESARSGKIVIV
jgi:predicted dehydrogenase